MTGVRSPMPASDSGSRRCSAGITTSLSTTSSRTSARRLDDDRPLAARTSTLRLGALVTPITFRAPALLANAVATADHISGGRIELGLGAGWMEREHEAFGFPFPELRVRRKMLAEQLEIVHRLWTEDGVSFSGEHYTLANAPGMPKPVQSPRPPIQVGGSGTRGTAIPATRFPDEYNTAWIAHPQEFAGIRQWVSAACEEVGRDPATMRFSLAVHCVVGTTGDEAMERRTRSTSSYLGSRTSTTGSSTSRNAASSVPSKKWRHAFSLMPTQEPTA
jgi:alkanesulfonate monooxygenase SsuD/methylene tetrahydromethanopterin reductase-like flavin-dependent oxidoreductase (luciferase family)